jgi:hypothetical protein
MASEYGHGRALNDRSGRFVDKNAGKLTSGHSIVVSSPMSDSLTRWNSFVDKEEKVIYLNYLGAPYDPHPSEQLSPQACDYVVEVTDENRQWAMVQVLDYLRNTFGDPTSKPRVYIGGNIHGERNYEEIFLYLERLGREFGFEPLVPLDATDRYRWANLVLEKPFHEASRELVIGDIQLISNSHAAFFWLERPSIGVAMEIVAASLNERPTVIVTPHLDLFYHPWLQSFGKVIWSDDQREGWKYLHSLFFPETI